MNENKDKLTGTDLSTFEALIKEGRQAVEKQDDDAIKSVSERLEKEAHRIAQVMYQSGGGVAGHNGGAPPPEAGGAGAPPAGEKKKEGGVIDAEFEETQ
jgi:molecular chaperone DnaK